MLKRIRELLGKRKKPDASTKGATAAAATAPDTAADRPPVKRGPTVAHHPISQADLDPDAVKIVRRLTRFEHRAYLVGGCVRDLLLNRNPKDFDVATSATPRQMKRLFRNCRIIGRRFRLAHIYFQHGKIIEVATFRTRDVDEDDEDTTGKDLLIREDNVFGTPEEDALRRDFTINSLFYDVNDGNVIDHAEGLADLRQRLVRTIGDPAIRFREDPVRILRAIKFAARLDFRIEKQTSAALSRARKEIEKAASPRILEEIARFGREGASRRSYELLRETKILEIILPEIAAQYSKDAGAWELLLRLLERTDRARHGDKRAIRLGETFAVLLLPTLTGAFGWKADGTVDPPKGLDMREVVDDALRSMALRLRIPRREQEYCRQILITLQRVVSTKRMRSGTRRSIQSRDCYADVLWILGVVAESSGGAFASAFEHWSSYEPLAPRDEGGEERTSRRRRRRRGGRGRGKRADGPRSATQAGSKPATEAGSKPATKAKSATKAKPATRAKASPEGGKTERRKPPSKARPEENMPSPWDDDYFFAALPTLPEDGRSSDPAKADPAEADPPADPAGVETDDAPVSDREARPEGDGDEAAPAPRRRRRRRRRRKKPGSSKDADTETAGSEPKAGGDGEPEG